MSRGNESVLDGVRRLEALPEGWTYLRGALTAPLGWRWASNGVSRFDPRGGYEHALIRVREGEGS